MKIGKNLLGQVEKLDEIPAWKWRKNHYLYFILDIDKNGIKIGIATDLKQRFKSLQSMNLNTLQILHSIKFFGTKYKSANTISKKFESQIHETFKDYRIRNEWFRYEGILKDFIEQL